jgi:hypothetical protein
VLEEIEMDTILWVDVYRKPITFIIDANNLVEWLPYTSAIIMKYTPEIHNIHDQRLSVQGIIELDYTHP